MSSLRSLGAAADAKAALRRERLAARRAMSEAQRAEQSRRLTDHLLAVCAEPGVRTVACYASFGTEPSTVRLLAQLRAERVAVLLPVVLDSHDLSWVDDVGTDRGVEAIGEGDLVIVPGLAVDRAGHRLGRGGGSYDRALARVAAGVPTVLLLFDGELVEDVPVEPHDVSVTHVMLPSGLLRLESG